MVCYPLRLEQEVVSIQGCKRDSVKNETCPIVQAKHSVAACIIDPRSQNIGHRRVAKCRDVDDVACARAAREIENSISAATCCENKGVIVAASDHFIVALPTNKGVITEEEFAAQKAKLLA